MPFCWARLSAKRFIAGVGGNVPWPIRDIRDEPTLLDLGYGEAWVVQVESVEAEPINWPANKTNRLLWDTETGF